MEPYFLPDGTIGWLLDALAADKLPELKDCSEIDAATHTLMLSLDGAPTTWIDPELCVEIDGPTELTLEAGDRFATGSALAEITHRRNGATSSPVTIWSAPYAFDARTVVVGPIDVVLQPADAGVPIPLCVSHR